MKIFNSHVHSNNSKDCKATMEEICHAALDKGICGIAITDHCEISSFISEDAYRRTKASALQTAKIKNECSGKLFVGVGCEIGDGRLNPMYTGRILDLAEFDVVLASVHVTHYQGKIYHLSRVDFSKLLPEAIEEYVTHYFDDVLETVCKSDFDVLAHLTLPIRYIKAECGMNVEMADYDAQIDSILKALIERDKALEVNTSEINRIGLMPGKGILSRYRELGGKKVTIGSDAHSTAALTMGVEIAINCLRECGFTNYGYYCKRKYVPVEI